MNRRTRFCLTNREMCIQLTSRSLRKSQRRTQPTDKHVAAQSKVIPSVYATTLVTMLIDIQVSTHIHHQLLYHLIVLTSMSRAMPALPRPETDYERWMRDRDPAIQIREKPQYGPDPISNHEPVVEYPSSMNVSNPQLLLYVTSIVLSRLALYQ